MRQRTEAEPVVPAALRAIVAALPDSRIAALVLELVQSAATGDDERAPAPRDVAAAAPPAAPPQDMVRKRPGWPKGRRRKAGSPDAVVIARRARAAAAARAKRAARKAGKGAAKNGSGSNGNGTAEVRASAFWQHAERLSPGKPWRAVAREFNLNEALTLDCHRRGDLPPGVMGTAIERFLELPVRA